MSAQSRAPARLAVGLIGTGRVGAVLAAALARAGHHVVAGTGGSAESARRAARLLPGVPLLPAHEVVARAELVLLAVPDDQLAPLVARLAGTGAWRPGQLVVHTSGAHGVAVLAPATRAGALPFALHPAMTFTGASEDLDRLAGTTFGVTTPAPLRAVAEALVRQLGGEPVLVAEAARPLYHAALVVGANHLVTLVNEAADLLRRAGIERPDRMLEPLLGAALANALRSGDAALTGPVSRGDAGTVAGHLDTLAEHAPDAVAGYTALARLTVGRALAAGRLTPGQAGPLLDVLRRAPRPAGGAGAAQPSTGVPRRRRASASFVAADAAPLPATALPGRTDDPARRGGHGRRPQPPTFEGHALPTRTRTDA